MEGKEIIAFSKWLVCCPCSFFLEAREAGRVCLPLGENSCGEYVLAVTANLGSGGAGRSTMTTGRRAARQPGGGNNQEGITPRRQRRSYRHVLLQVS